ncbi:MAG: right-handed parallel beta-helix repeat-containing protein, partial [Bacteroidota bacterium]|nr:right-handed parallel beta-helix repeat-containing protein [Bacteroidota bacterium]
MKKLFFLPIFIIGMAANATNYYISANGNDANNGTSASSSWKTLAKLNSFFSSLNPGDNVLLNRGDTFYGSITISKSGSPGAPITISAYGAGANPVITGFTTVTSWTNLGNNIWESTNSVSTLSNCNMVVINGVNTPMGRYPNSGWLNIDSHSGNTSITSNSLSALANWTGAEVVTRTLRWVIDRGTISSQSGNTINYTKTGTYEPSNGWGFFIQNSTSTLDQQNEWYYNPFTKRIRVYSTFSPMNVQLATIDTLININNYNYITFSNIFLQGANKIGIKLNQAKYISIQNCNFNYSGLSAIDAFNYTVFDAPYLIVNNCTFNNTNDVAINAGSSDNIIITNNTIKNSGIISGAGRANLGWYKGIHSYGNYGNISYNTIDSSGYNALEFDGDATIVSNNFITNFGFVMDDGGGIYTFPSQGARVNVQRSIKHNIILNGIGAGAGTDEPTSNQAMGIYLDGTSSNFNIIGNTAENAGVGLFLNGAHEVNVDSNTLYNNTSDNQMYVRKYDATPLTNLVIKNNIFFSRSTTPTNQYCVNYEPMATVMPLTLTSDSNYYPRPIDDNLTIWVNLNGNASFKTLAQWQLFSGQDIHSKKSPKTITDPNDLKFEYNATSLNRIVSLDGNYIDVEGNTYLRSITLAPYSSVVLIRTSVVPNIPPIANAGADKTITLPINTVSLSGSGTDADGTVTTYLWTKISGPSSYNTVNASSPVTDVTGLVEGIYVFQLKVTDNNGASATSTLQVIVNAAANIPPVANADADKTITLPLNTVLLSGSGTDVDGTITSYLWTQISGTTSYNIVNASSPVTDVTGLVQGVYVFQLTVTDNNGASAISTMQVTVNAAANIPPVANAGANVAITLPANTVSLLGSGTDADGTVTNYLWIKISGPSSVTITNFSSASTNVSGLVQGVYVFQLTVTDNIGATSTSTVEVTVNPAANIPPLANAGVNIAITLPANSVSLLGSGRDADGTVTNYLWTKISGPLAATITNPSSATTNVSGLVQGVYVFQLKVTDNNGASGTSILQVTVNAAANIPPVANAGANKSITLPNNIVSLSGNGSDADGTVVSYLWSKISGPLSYNIINPSSPVTDVSALVQGVYVFQLKITDNSGATATSTVQVTVNAAANIPPVANAGSDKSITLPVSTIT